ncbi:MAG: PAS domain-containing protein [Nitrospiraceae bacterium]|nr:PAS domain-containing protein [Nitrospiraceae bacterium]
MQTINDAGLDSLISAIGFPVIIFDALGSVVRINPAAARFGPGFFSCGNEAGERMIEKLDIRRPDGRRFSAEELPFLRALEGETVQAEDLVFTDGRGEPVFMEASAAPLFSASGDPDGAVFILHDVTKRERLLRDVQLQKERLEAGFTSNLEEMVLERLRLLEANRRLKKEIYGGEKAREDRARLAAAVESTDEVVTIIDRQGRIEYVNPSFERTTGYAGKEVLGRSPVILGSDRHESSLYMGFLEAVMTGRTWAGRTVNRKKNGELVRFEGSISPVRDHEGKVISYVSVSQDITGRMRLESIAEAASTMNSLGYAFSGLRHELVNPLNSIKLSFGVLQRKIDPGMKTYLDRVQAEVARMEYLLKSLKNFNMNEGMELRELDLAAFLDDFASLVRPDFSGKGISVELDAPEAASAMCDPRALKQVLLNLAANAADALEGVGGARMLLGLFRQDGKVVIRVADNGAGMDEELMKNLFKPFATTKKQGTGLGLVIVKKMITKMGGEVKVASTRGQGTTIDIFLPAVRS